MCRPSCTKSGSSASVHPTGQTASFECRETEPPMSPHANIQRPRFSSVTSRQVQGKGYPTMSQATWLSLHPTCHALLAKREARPMPALHRKYTEAGVGTLRPNWPKACLVVPVSLHISGAPLEEPPAAKLRASEIPALAWECWWPKDTGQLPLNFGAQPAAQPCKANRGTFQGIPEGLQRLCRGHGWGA